MHEHKRMQVERSGVPTCKISGLKYSSHSLPCSLSNFT